MDCPNGHGPMLRGQKSWVCEVCGQRRPLTPPDTPPSPAAPRPELADLPSVLAIVWQEYEAEAHPVLRLHRLCDALEILTRFCAAVALGEVRVRLGPGPLPEELLQALQPQIERPTFGQWCNMLRALLGSLVRGDALVVPELPNFISAHLLPWLKGGDLDAQESLLALRNVLAHGGGMTRAAAQSLLHLWEPRLGGMPARLAFLAGLQLCHFAGGVARRLAGPQLLAGEAVALPADLGEDLRDRGLEGHVLLLHAGCWLDLWPLCGYGRAVSHAPSGTRTAAEDSPLVYVRAQRARLLYAALGAELPQGEYADADTLGQFRRLFQLDARPTGREEQPADYEAEVRTDAAALVGRKKEVEQLKGLLKGADQGVFWVAGPAGIGKSFLLAKVAQDLGNARDVCRIAWRFRAGDADRCRRDAFFRHAAEKLGRWLGKAGLALAADPNELQRQLVGLLDEASARPAAREGARPPRVLFVLDGLDEIERSDPAFAELPLQMQRPNVLWLCSGRPVGNLPQVFTADRCTPAFPGGLPAMGADDIRGMLIDGTGRLKYHLLPLDREQAVADEGGKQRAVVVNEAVEAVVKRAAGLPLYVRFVVEDLLAGHFRFDELERKLPPGLDAYYDDLLRRLAIGELQALLTPLVVTLAWALAPLDEDTLHLLMTRRKVAAPGREGKALVRRGLGAVQAMVRPAPREGGEGVGYEPYHLTFREHVREDPGSVIGQQNALTRDELCALVLDWARMPEGHPARRYALRYGPRTLREAERWGDLEALLTDIAFLEAKAQAGLLFELAGELTDASAWLPPDRQVRPLLPLLAAAVRQDLYFLARWSASLFQSLWNLCWWYDCPAAPQYYQPPPEGRVPPWAQPGPKLHALLEEWRRRKELATPGFAWMRSLLPPAAALGAGPHMVLRGHQGGITSVAWSLDGERLASGSDDGTARTWDARTGLPLHRLAYEFSSGPVCVAFGPGRRVASAWNDDTARIWDADTGAEFVRFSAPRALYAYRKLAVAWSLDGERVVTWAGGYGIHVWDAGSGALLTSWPGGAFDCCAYDGRWAVAEATTTERQPGRAILIWDLREGRDHARAIEFQSAAWEYGRSLAFSPDGRFLAFSRHTAATLVWHIPSGRGVPLDGADATGESQGLTWSPDGSRLIAGDELNGITVWDIPSGRVLRRLARVPKPHGVWLGELCLSCSPNGADVAEGHPDGTIRVWGTGGNAAVLQARPEYQDCSSLAFSPDGQRLAIGGREGVHVLHGPGGWLPRLIWQGNVFERLGWSPSGESVVLYSDNEWSPAELHLSPDGQNENRHPAYGYGPGPGDLAPQPSVPWEYQHDPEIGGTAISRGAADAVPLWISHAVRDISCDVAGRLLAIAAEGYLYLFAVEGIPRPESQAK